MNYMKIWLISLFIVCFWNTSMNLVDLEKRSEKGPNWRKSNIRMSTCKLSIYEMNFEIKMQIYSEPIEKEMKALEQEEVIKGDKEHNGNI